MKSVAIILVLVFVAVSEAQRGIPPEIKCYIPGLLNSSCQSKLRSICKEFSGDDRKPIPMPKSRFGGQCPILGQVIPLSQDLSSVDLPPCPCQGTIGVSLFHLKHF